MNFGEELENAYPQSFLKLLLDLPACWPALTGELAIANSSVGKLGVFQFGL